MPSGAASPQRRDPAPRSHPRPSAADSATEQSLPAQPCDSRMDCTCVGMRCADSSACFTTAATQDHPSSNFQHLEICSNDGRWTEVARRQERPRFSDASSEYKSARVLPTLRLNAVSHHSLQILNPPPTRPPHPEPPSSSSTFALYFLRRRCRSITCNNKTYVV